jgi:hypothetical protein
VRLQHGWPEDQFRRTAEEQADSESGREQNT